MNLVEKLKRAREIHEEQIRILDTQIKETSDYECVVYDAPYNIKTFKKKWVKITIDCVKKGYKEIRIFNNGTAFSIFALAEGKKTSSLNGYLKLPDRNTKELFKELKKSGFPVMRESRLIRIQEDKYSYYIRSLEEGERFNL